MPSSAVSGLAARSRPQQHLIWAAVAMACAGSAHGQSNPSAPNPFIEEIRQQERERALREQQERSVDVRLPTPAPAVTDGACVLAAVVDP